MFHGKQRVYPYFLFSAYSKRKDLSDGYFLAMEQLTVKDSFRVG